MPRMKSKAKKKQQKCSWHKVLYTVLVSLFIILLLIIFLGKKGHKGIDISHHQGKIDWEQVVTESDVEFVYIKATEGVSYTDKLYLHNRNQAKQHGLPVGPYHFFRADKPGGEQFLHFAEVIGNDFDLIPVLDLEELGGKITDKTKYREEVQTFISMFNARYGFNPIVYGSHSFMKDYVYPVAEDCDYWLAWYTPLAKAIRDKRRFINNARPRLHPRIWQYSDRGKISGISEYVDLDECWEIKDILVK